MPMRCGVSVRRPTLIEWDNDLPTLARLTAEARRADEVAAAAFEGREPHVVAR